MNQTKIGETSDKDIIINYTQDIDYEKQQIIFDEKIYEKIRKEELDLTPDLVFNNQFCNENLKI